MKKINNHKGFTLIEVLVAVFLLAVGLMSVANMQTTAISGNKFAKDGSVAIQLAEEMIDRIRLNGGIHPEIYSGIDTGANLDCTGFANPAYGDCIQWRDRMRDKQLGLVNARGKVNVTRGTPLEFTTQIEVTVQWGSAWGVKSRTVTLSTVMEIWGT